MARKKTKRDGFGVVQVGKIMFIYRICPQCGRNKRIKKQNDICLGCTVENVKNVEPVRDRIKRYFEEKNNEDTRNT